MSTGRVRDGGTACALWGARVRAPWRLWKGVIDAAMAAAPKWWWPEEQGTLGDGRARGLQKMKLKKNNFEDETFKKK